MWILKPTKLMLLVKSYILPGASGWSSQSYILIGAGWLYGAQVVQDDMPVRRVQLLKVTCHVWTLAGDEERTKAETALWIPDRGFEYSASSQTVPTTILTVSFKLTNNLNSSRVDSKYINVLHDSSIHTSPLCRNTNTRCPPLNSLVLM